MGRSMNNVGPALAFLVGIIYLFTSLGYYLDGQKGSALMFFSYSLANAGFLMQTGWK
jgi:hypothetical protein